MSNYFKHKMRTKKTITIAFWILFGIVAAICLVALFGYVVMWLWNALVPEIFGLTTISYWQAVGLLVLFKLLFGGFGGGGSKKRSSGKRKKFSCDESTKKDFSKWELYDQFWEEEGNEAYIAYKNRIHESHDDE